MKTNGTIFLSKTSRTASYIEIDLDNRRVFVVKKKAPYYGKVDIELIRKALKARYQSHNRELHNIKLDSYFPAFFVTWKEVNIL